jgi:hypothetical protein
VPGSGFLLGAWSEIECGRNEGDNFWSYYTVFVVVIDIFVKLDHLSYFFKKGLSYIWFIIKEI